MSMLDAHEQDQDCGIKANAEAINQVADYLHEIRDHFEPISAFVEKVPDHPKLVAIVTPLLTVDPRQIRLCFPVTIPEKFLDDILQFQDGLALVTAGAAALADQFAFPRVFFASTFCRKVQNVFVG